MENEYCYIVFTGKVTIPSEFDYIVKPEIFKCKILDLTDKTVLVYIGINRTRYKLKAKQHQVFFTLGEAKQYLFKVQNDSYKIYKFRLAEIEKNLKDIINPRIIEC